MRPELFFLLDVDNTLLDNDGAEQDYCSEIGARVGREAADRFWEIFEAIKGEVGYADYLGALQRYRLEDMHDPRLLHVSSYLLDYPFERRLYPRVIEVIRHLQEMGGVAIITDGDVVFQPRKVGRSGLWDAVGGNVLFCVHKERELHAVERRFPADRYVMVEDKLRILTAVKGQWGRRVATVFVRQGHYALDPGVLAAYPPADVTLDAVTELVDWGRQSFVGQEAFGRDGEL